MPNLKLVADPTFTAPVPIPMAGGKSVNVVMTFKHRTKTEMEKWMESRAEHTRADSFRDVVTKWEQDGTLKPESAEQLHAALTKFMTDHPPHTDAESFMEMVVGWDLTDPFTRESVDLLTENYIGAGLATYRVYVDELIQAKIKN